MAPGSDYRKDVMNHSESPFHNLKTQSSSAAPIMQIIFLASRPGMFDPGSLCRFVGFQRRPICCNFACGVSSFGFNCELDV
jgi:hypothetical protein